MRFLTDLDILKAICWNVHNEEAMAMGSEQELVEAVKKATAERDGRMTLRCADAFKLAEQFGTAPGTIGRICNENRIKIVQCQLGCFK